MNSQNFPADAFGDRFVLEELPLPRPPAGYAVQRLNTDTLLDKSTMAFLPVRSVELQCLFSTFDEAYAAACQWMTASGTEPDAHLLAIVPAGFDPVMGRHILIHGVLRGEPEFLPFFGD